MSLVRICPRKYNNTKNTIFFIFGISFIFLMTPPIDSTNDQNSMRRVVKVTFTH